MDNVLFISDLHAPYQHKDALYFLEALHSKHKFKRIINVGDEMDYHAMSFHDTDPNLLNAGDELKKAKKALQQLESIFPEMDLMESNHGSMKYRRAKAHGIPVELMVPYATACGVGQGWQWFPHRTYEFGSHTVHVTHGKGVSTRRNVEQMGCCFVQGHYHGLFELVYNGTPHALNWGMTVGCLIDDESLAFAYNKNTLKRPVLGCGGIIDGKPVLFPMILRRGGRWSRKI